MLAFMAANSFALLITEGSELKATHLPFVVQKNGDKIRLVSHMAKANPQWKEFNGDKELLVVFHGPHAYISPTLYEKKENVPTWNYLAVHAYGKVKLISDEAAVKELLGTMINTYEKTWLKEYKELPADYLDKMVKGIVAFEIEVTRLQGKSKLSQNKTANEKQNIITSLEKSADGQAQELAKQMKKKYQ